MVSSCFVVTVLVCIPPFTYHLFSLLAASVYIKFSVCVCAHGETNISW